MDQSVRTFPLNRKQIILLANLFFWITFAVFDILTIGGMLNGYYSAMSIRFILHGVLFAGLIYPNLNFLYPVLLSRHKYVEYAVAVLLLLAINIFLRTQLDLFLIHSNRPDSIFFLVYESVRANKAITTLIDAGFYSPTDGFFTSYYIGMTIGSIGVFFITAPIRLVEDWYKKHQLELKLLLQKVEQNQAAAKIREEKLKFLKAQTDPHFLINAISGVYHLALINSEQVDQALLHLSELLSYMLGYGKEDFILLKHEIHFIESYIDFNKVVYQNEFILDFQHNATPAQIDSLHIPPVLLQPFFENAIKYHNQNADQKLIKSELKVESRYILFSIENQFTPAESDNWYTTSHGIGIQNVKERLELYLPNQYDLQFKVKKSIFRVELAIYLNKEKCSPVQPGTESFI